MQKDSGCCPIGSEPQLSTDYKPKGKEDKLGDLPIYTIGSGDKAIIVAYDIYGYNGGRTRLICDQLADAGFNVILPDFYRGDAWPTEKPIDDSLAKFILAYPWEKVQKDLHDHVYPYLEKQGAKTIGMIGFCWGAWVIFKEAEGDKLTCGVSCHPSIRASNFFGESEIDMTKKVKSPQCLLSAGNDPDNVKDGGEVLKILEEKFPGKCLFKTYPNSAHGFVCRGDLSNKDTAADVKDAMTNAVEYFKKHL
mmetsp:Transcript_32408/g.29210  ORF Transcript_32408/g.29210 Transcript_32408/m.29210 type:complete len:250 (+) Transcript_32408:75-824(+)